MTSSERFAMLLVALTVVAAGCAPRISALRFANREPVWRVDDRPIRLPEARRAAHNAEEMRDARAPLLRALTVPGRVPARAVNSLDEVPDSTWFENRIGMRDVPPAAIARGPGDGEEPVPPFVVVGMKDGGHGIGVEVEDALGERYLLKFDGAGSPEVETAIGLIVQRLLWAAGYHVPEDDVVVLARSDLTVADDAIRALDTGEDVRMTADDLEELLRTTAQPTAGGLVRGLASKLLPGVPIGGYPVSGVRPDDPNDRVPHELRRDVRGQLTFFAWLGHTDAKVDNTLDVWTPIAAGAERGYVVHYLLDFGLALGAKARLGMRPHDGYSYNFDLGRGAGSLFAFGLHRRPWERLDPAETNRYGRFGARTFDPARFRTSRPYVPFLFADRFDAYWASKIIVRFTREHVEAAVAEARFSNPVVHARFVDAILARQRRVARHWFGEVAPVDYFRIVRPEGVDEDARAMLCAEDLGLRHGLAGDPTETRYAIEAFDRSGEPIHERADAPGRADGHVCVEAPRGPAQHDGYVMVRFTTSRDGDALPPVIAHLAPHPESGLLRLIGIDRR